MTKKDLTVSVKKMMSAPSCYAGLKDKAQAWLDSIDTAKEADIAKDLIAEIEADITTIDNLVAFAHSDHAKEIFGDGAAAFAAHADELKATGVKYCDCPACSAGLEVLENKSLILK